MDMEGLELKAQLLSLDKRYKALKKDNDRTTKEWAQIQVDNTDLKRALGDALDCVHSQCKSSGITEAREILARCMKKKVRRVSRADTSRK